jgi:hypothetical protein
MTATNMDLQELLEKTAATDFLREMIGFTAQLMELEPNCPSLPPRRWTTRGDMLAYIDSQLPQRVTGLHSTISRNCSIARSSVTQRVSLASFPNEEAIYFLVGVIASRWRPSHRTLSDDTDALDNGVTIRRPGLISSVPSALAN